MNYRIWNKEVIKEQLAILGIVRHFGRVRLSSLESLLREEAAELLRLNEAISAIEDPGTREILNALEKLIKSVYFLAKWAKAKLEADVDPDRYLTAASTQLMLISLPDDGNPPARPSVLSISRAIDQIKSITTIVEIEPLFDRISNISLPFEFSTLPEPFSGSKSKTLQEDLTPENRPVLSVLLSIGGDLWANPQVVKPNLNYRITGEISVNFWPSGYDKLTLYPVSTTDNSWFVLSLPQIKRFTEASFEMSGSVIFYHAQANFEEALSVKLFAQFTGKDLPDLLPIIIGYDELKVKVLNEYSFPLLSRFPQLHQKIITIWGEIAREMKSVPDEERDDFLLLLSALLNYQGYCAQFGVFKNKETVKELEFRDLLIQFLSADPRLTKTIVKEGELAGGKVEINYAGIVAELKVEDKIAERKTIIENHQKQTAAYATGAQKQLSILCILDLTRKTLPPALPANNVFFIEPAYHGFKTRAPELASRMAVVFIDGNTPKPSEY